MIEAAIGTAIGADIAISVNAGRLDVRKHTVADPEQEVAEPSPTEVTFDWDAVRFVRGVIYVTAIFVTSAALLIRDSGRPVAKPRISADARRSTAVRPCGHHHECLQSRARQLQPRSLMLVIRYSRVVPSLTSDEVRAPA